jgi:hypothetical protein
MTAGSIFLAKSPAPYDLVSYPCRAPTLKVGDDGMDFPGAGRSKENSASDSRKHAGEVMAKLSFSFENSTLASIKSNGDERK